MMSRQDRNAIIPSTSSSSSNTNNASTAMNGTSSSPYQAPMTVSEVLRETLLEASRLADLLRPPASLLALRQQLNVLYNHVSRLLKLTKLGELDEFPLDRRGAVPDVDRDASVMSRAPYDTGLLPALSGLVSALRPTSPTDSARFLSPEKESHVRQLLAELAAGARALVSTEFIAPNNYRSLSFSHSKSANGSQDFQRQPPHNNQPSVSGNSDSGSSSSSGGGGYSAAGNSVSNVNGSISGAEHHGIHGHIAGNHAESEGFSSGSVNPGTNKPYAKAKPVALPAQFAGGEPNAVKSPVRGQQEFEARAADRSGSPSIGAVTSGRVAYMMRTFDAGVGSAIEKPSNLIMHSNAHGSAMDFHRNQTSFGSPTTSVNASMSPSSSSSASSSSSSLSSSSNPYSSSTSSLSSTSSSAVTASSSSSSSSSSSPSSASVLSGRSQSFGASRSSAIIEDHATGNYPDEFPRHRAPTMVGPSVDALMPVPAPTESTGYTTLVTPIASNFVLIPINGAFDSELELDLSGAKAVRFGRIGQTQDVNAMHRFIPFNSQVVSRNHAEIWEVDNKYYIRDIGSNSGTFVNGARLSVPGKVSDAHEVFHNDIIQFGVDYRVRAADDETPLETRLRCVIFKVFLRSVNAVMGSSSESLAKRERQPEPVQSKQSTDIQDDLSKLYLGGTVRGGQLNRVSPSKPEEKTLMWDPQSSPSVNGTLKGGLFRHQQTIPENRAPAQGPPNLGIHRYKLIVELQMKKVITDIFITDANDFAGIRVNLQAWQSTKTVSVLDNFPNAPHGDQLLLQRDPQLHSVFHVFAKSQNVAPQAVRGRSAVADYASAAIGNTLGIIEFNNQLKFTVRCPQATFFVTGDFPRSSYVFAEPPRTARMSTVLSGPEGAAAAASGQLEVIAGFVGEARGRKEVGINRYNVELQVDHDKPWYRWMLYASVLVALLN